MIAFRAGEPLRFESMGHSLTATISVASWYTVPKSQGIRKSYVRSSGSFYVVSPTFGGVVDFGGGDYFALGADFSGDEEPAFGISYDDLNGLGRVVGIDVDSDGGDAELFESQLMNDLAVAFEDFVFARLSGGVA
jgi:hypothetical protein